MATAMFEAAREIAGHKEPVADSAARRRWEADDALRAEFGTLDRFVAWTKAEAAGRVNISKPISVH